MKTLLLALACLPAFADEAPFSQTGRVCGNPWNMDESSAERDADQGAAAFCRQEEGLGSVRISDYAVQVTFHAPTSCYEATATYRCETPRP